MIRDLFYGGELSVWLHERLRRAIADVEATDTGRMRNEQPEVANVITRKWEVHPLTVDWSQLTATEVREAVQSQMQFGEVVHLRAEEFDVFVPFEGTPDLFSYRASTFSMSGTPAGSVDGQTLTFQIAALDMTPEKAQAQIEGLKGRLDQFIGWTNVDVNIWRSHLAERVTIATQQRKDRLDKNALLSSSGYPCASLTRSA